MSHPLHQTIKEVFSQIQDILTSRLLTKSYLILLAGLAGTRTKLWGLMKFLQQLMICQMYSRTDACLQHSRLDIKWTNQRLDKLFLFSRSHFDSLF